MAHGRTDRTIDVLVDDGADMQRLVFDAPGIRAVIAPRMPAIRACFAKESTPAPVVVFLDVN